MKIITFASFKGGAGKTTALMAVASSLISQGKKIALFEADPNEPLTQWRSTATEANTWDDDCKIMPSDELSTFEKSYHKAEEEGFDYVLVDTQGGGSELNNACLANAHAVVIPSALTKLDMTAALDTFQHTIELYQQMELDIPVALLIQRVPVGKLTVSQKQDLARLSDLPRCETMLHARDAFASIGRRGMLHLLYEQYASDKTNRISANHIATALNEARDLSNDILEAIGDK